ncbi:MAG TPA: apolipoprotein N-acyltransferase [Vicinamibacteria bacterium]|nr:apolipoprotein N-acyltransferase [Vicinamibacteria bacterium]
MTRPGRPEALAAASGVLLALSFPKFGHGLVAWVALVPLLVGLASAHGRGHGFRLGYVTGAVASLGIVYWTSLVVMQYGGLSAPLGIAVMVLLCLALALFPSLFGWLMAGWVRAMGPAALLLAPAAWVATEILRAHTLFNFAWCLLGYSQHDFPAVIQVARIGAVYAVSFVVVATSAAIAYAIVDGGRGRGARALSGAAALVAATLGYGSWVMGRPPSEAGRLRVGLVQASIPQDEKWDPAEAMTNYGHHVALTREAADRGARLVVWPESALPYLFDRTPWVAEALRALTRERGLFLLFGNDDREVSDDRRRRIWVGAKMLAPDGTLALRYHKMRLVPFGEYVPIESVLTLGGRFTARLVQEVGSFTPGAENVTGNVDRHAVGASICYEAIFPDHAREFVRNGAGLLANITNDAWYGTTSAPYQHFAMAKFRAVENGRYLVRAANTGITAIVDSRGRVVEATRLFERRVLVGEVPILSETTPYTRHGDVFAWGCLGAAIALAAARWREARPR